MAKFRKKPVVIEAVQYAADASNGAEVRDFIGEIPTIGSIWPPHRIPIKTLEGIMWASPGDWIIRGVKGECYPCKDEIFRMTYEAAE